MKKFIAAATCLAPTLAFAFQPLPIPDCPDSNSTSTETEVVATAKCKIEMAMAVAYNSTQGKMPDSVFACASMTDEVLNHRLMQGPSHDSHVMVCTQVALHMGLLTPIF